MDFEVKMQGGEPLSTMKVSESEGRLEGLATAVTPNKNSRGWNQQQQQRQQQRWQCQRLAVQVWPFLQGEGGGVLDPEFLQLLKGKAYPLTSAGNRYISFGSGVSSFVSKI